MTDFNKILTTNGTSDDIKKIVELFEGSKPPFEYDQGQAIKEYKVDEHEVFSTEKRPNKTVKKDSGEKDTKGNPVTTTISVDVARIGMSYQELIVDRRVGFMLSEPVGIDAIYSKNSTKEQELVNFLEQIQNDNKMDYKNKDIARRLMSEMEVAELWYLTETGETKPRFTVKVKILSKELGDSLYPLFDNNGDMIAFGRFYKIKEDKAEIEHFDVYTSEFEYKYVNRDNIWKLDDEAESMTAEGIRKINPIPNAVGKIMVIYHSQKVPEWSNVQTMIDRREKLASNHADSNDYFGSPLLKVKGQVEGYAQKGEQGKVLQMSENADASYLSWDSSPESIKQEKEDLKQDIFAMTQTPDISFASMMKVGGQLSGVALKMMFLDCHMAVRVKEEIFGLGLQRRLNLLKACIGNVIDTTFSEVAKKLQVKPVITPYLPSNDTEKIENLTVSVDSGIMSKQTAVEQHPLVSDSEAEMVNLQKDAEANQAGL